MRHEQFTNLRDGGKNTGGDRLSNEAALLMAKAEPDFLRFDKAHKGNSDKLGLPALIIGGCENGGPGCEARSGWRPAPRDSVQGRAWQKQDEQQRGKPLEIGPDGTYQAKKGDCLSRIAERSLQGEGNKQPSKAEIQNQMKRIIEANPILKCNPDLLKEGERLKIPGRKHEIPGSNEPKPNPSDRGGARPGVPSENPPVCRPEPPVCKPPERPRTPAERPVDPRTPRPEQPACKPDDKVPPSTLPGIIKGPYVWPVEFPGWKMPAKPEPKPGDDVTLSPKCPPERKTDTLVPNIKTHLYGTDSASSELSGVIAYENGQPTSVRLGR